MESQNNLREYLELLRKGYIHRYLEPSTKNFIVSHPKHGADELVHNVAHALFYLNAGENVILLERLNTKKSADCYKGAKKILFEFERTSKNKATTIQRRIREAKKQSEYISIWIDTETTSNELIHAIYLCRLKNCNYFDKIEQLDLIANNEIISITKKQALSKEFEKIIREALKNE